MASTNDGIPSIPEVPGPWTLKGTVYTFFYYCTSSELKNVPTSLLYSPLEAESSFATGKAVGGLCSIQVIRYTESPVGPYDEMLLVPGSFGYEKKDGKTIVRKKNLRVTRIYVSQKHTCFNGRKNWNIPKHLARFEFNTLSGGGTEIKVFPHDTDFEKDPTEASAAAVPFFRAVFTQSSWLPTFPVDVSLFRYLGVDLSLVQPPLPQGQGSQGELAGTDLWHKIMPVQHTKKASIGWWDVKQSGEKANEADPLLANSNENEAPVNDKGSQNVFENWWPGLGRWKLGMKLEDATIVFEKGESWKL